MKSMTTKEIVRALLLVGWKRKAKDDGGYLLTGPEGNEISVPEHGEKPLPDEVTRAIFRVARLLY